MICKRCNNQYDITPQTLIEERIVIRKDDESAVLRLVYFQCPSCGEMRFAIVDDKRTLYYAGRLNDAKSKGTQERHKERLRTARKQLAERWRGGVFEITGVEYVLDLNLDEEV